MYRKPRKQHSLSVQNRKPTQRKNKKKSPTAPQQHDNRTTHLQQQQSKQKLRPKKRSTDSDCRNPHRKGNKQHQTQEHLHNSKKQEHRMSPAAQAKAHTTHLTSKKTADTAC